MGLLFVFLREEKPIHSPVFLKSPSFSSILKPRTSNNLLSRAQSTISICALFVFITLLVFTLCTFEPSISTPNPRRISSRRVLSQKSLTQFRSPLTYTRFLTSIWGHGLPNRASPGSSDQPPAALQGMGVLHRRGTEAMDDLAICHVPENVTEDGLRLFLRLLHRSGATSKSDVVLIFSASSPSFDSVIREENASFLRLARRRGRGSSSRSSLSFDATRFAGNNKTKGVHREPLWGKKEKKNHGNSDGYVGDETTESARSRYGSVVGFEAAELDPENALGGFMDAAVPMSLRRWACYQMLLGRVRRNFKHVMLVDVHRSAVLRDPLDRVRGERPETVFLWTKKHSGRRRPGPPLTSAVVMGGARGIRRLANSMLLGIVRSATQHRRKVAVSESALVSQLAGNAFLRKSVDVKTSAESIPDAGPLGKLSPHYWSSPASLHHSVILRGNDQSREFDSAIMKEICSSEDETEINVYQNCLKR